MIMLVLVAASYGGHSVNSKAEHPSAGTVFYRIDTDIRKLESLFWKQGILFLKEKRKRLRKVKCYIAVDETYESYTGKLLRKEKKGKKLTDYEKEVLKFIHKYKPKRGDTGSYKYLVFALVYGNIRKVLRMKMLRKRERYKPFITKTLLELKKYVNYECALLDRGFYDGKFIKDLNDNKIPFIMRARLSKYMKKILGIYPEWELHKNFEIGKTKTGADLILGKEFCKGKTLKWGFITNLKPKNLYDIRLIYKKRWNIENIFKACDGIQLKIETNNPDKRMFSVCLTFLLYNAWQQKNRTTLLNYVIEILETIFENITQTIKNYRDKLRINLPFWNIIIQNT